MFRLHKYLCNHIPELSNSFIMDSGASIGIRDSRHFHCAQRLSVKGCQTLKSYEDSIAVGGHILDIHATDGSNNQTRDTIPAYEIPLGSLIIPDIPNLLLAGRTLDADYEMFASARVMGTCMAMGEGVGLAAAICVRQQIPTSEIPLGELRSRLEANGAIITLDKVI